MTRGSYQTRFRPVVEAAIRYRDAEGDREWRAARQLLAVAVLRWAFGLAGPVTPALPLRFRCDRWAALVDAAIEYATPEGSTTISGWSPERRDSCAAWHRLHHAAGRWADVAIFVASDAVPLPRVVREEVAA